MDSIAFAVKNRLKMRSRGVFVDAKEWAQLFQFYSDRHYQPIWYKRSALKQDLIGQLAERLEHAPDSGLKRYELQTYDQYQESLQKARQETIEAAKIQSRDKQPAGPAEQKLSEDDKAAWYELTASELLLIHARSLASGQYIPAVADKDWHIEPPSFNAVAFLRAFAGSDQPFKMLDSLEPVNHEYLKLKEVLKHYRELVARGGWPKLPSAMPTLKPGMESEAVPALRKRLQAEKPFTSAAGSDSHLYDDDLVKAVKEFQGGYGLTKDGVVGRKTRMFLNTPMNKRVQSIVATMERWRWMPRNLQGRYILVNLPSYYLNLYDGGRPVWGTRVINGSKEHPSPSITTKIQRVMFNPKWHVPNSIAVNELIPKQLQDPDYLSHNGYRVLERGTNVELDPYSIPWEEYYLPKDFPYLIRQGSGDDNALGRLKFVMPNRQHIYLHDTPTKNLFERDARAFSHGCIRVQSPYELAGLLLNKDDPEQGRWSVLQGIDKGETEEVDLPEQVPVFLTYFTADVDAEDVIHFRQDIYGRDSFFDRDQ